MYKLISKITGRPILVDINKLYGIKTQTVAEVAAPVETEEPAVVLPVIDEVKAAEDAAEAERLLKLQQEKEAAEREKTEAEKTKQAYDSACSILNKKDEDIIF